MAKKEMSQIDKMLNIIGSFMLLIFAVIYISLKIDLIPSTMGALGLLDDAIILLLFAYFAWRLWNRGKRRIREGRKEGTWKLEKVLKALGQPGTWVGLLLLGVAIAWFVWSWKLGPLSASIGYVDRLVMIIVGGLGFIKLIKGDS